MLKKEDFKLLFDSYFEDVRRYIFYRSGDEDLATDVAQDTFMKIWEKRDNIDTKKVKGLLFKIANDLFISAYRKKKVAFNFFNNFEPNEKGLTPEDNLNYNELKRAYESALKSMPEKQRVVFLMNRVDEFKYKEIAEKLNLSVKAIEKRMSLALEHLRKELKDKITGFVLFLLGFSLSRAKNKEK